MTKWLYLGAQEKLYGRLQHKSHSIRSIVNVFGVCGPRKAIQMIISEKVCFFLYYFPKSSHVSVNPSVYFIQYPVTVSFPGVEPR